MAIRTAPTAGGPGGRGRPRGLGKGDFGFAIVFVGFPTAFVVFHMCPLLSNCFVCFPTCVCLFSNSFVGFIFRVFKTRKTKVNTVFTILGGF